MNHLYYHAIFYSGTKHAPVVFKFTTLASHLYRDITICSDTLHCTPSSLILLICCSGLSSFSHFLTPLSSLLTSHLHPSPASLSEMTHYNASILQKRKHLFLSLPHLSHLLLSHLLFTRPLSLTHTHPSLLPLSSLSPPSLLYTHAFRFSLHHICLIHLLFLPLTSYLPPFSLPLLPAFL